MSSRAADRFETYAARMAAELGDEATFWTTINEPEVYNGLSYMLGVWPPAKKSPLAYLLVDRHLINAHRLAYRAIKSSAPHAQIGAAINNTYFEAAAWPLRPISQGLKRGMDWWINDHFRQAILQTSDWLGLNYYMRFCIRLNPMAHSDRRELQSDLGWELYPQGHEALLLRLKRYGKPIYVTESGLADAQDRHRSWYIRESLAAISRAASQGVDVRGYFHWSLLDNFEWDKGYWPKFGLIEVDRVTLERRIRPSAYEYREMIREFASG